MNKPSMWLLNYAIRPHIQIFNAHSTMTPAENFADGTSMGDVEIGV